MKNFKPAVIDGAVVGDYFVCEEGNLWSKKYGYLKKMRPAVAGQSPYPGTTIMIDGKRKSVKIHRVVCETFHAFPHPTGVTESEWKRTPSSVKKLMQALYQVNHIDHDHENHHPSNLEWVTNKQNVEKYQKHRRANV